MSSFRNDQGSPYSRGGGSRRGPDVRVPHSFEGGSATRSSGYGYNAQGYNLRGASQGYVRDHNGYDRNGYPVQGASVRRNRNGRPVYANTPTLSTGLGRQRVPMGGIPLEDEREDDRRRRRRGDREGREDRGDRDSRRGTARRDQRRERPVSNEPMIGNVRILPIIALLILILAVVIGVRGCMALAAGEPAASAAQEQAADAGSSAQS